MHTESSAYEPLVLIPGPVYRQDIDSRINCCLSDRQDLGSVVFTQISRVDVF